MMGWTNVTEFPADGQVLCSLVLGEVNTRPCKGRREGRFDTTQWSLEMTCYRIEIGLETVNQTLRA